ncbi:MAG: hypothetical protein Q4D88_04375 [Anaerococcus sp.]|nr:hypothetical protein [Anaerococcus sp.]
MAEEENTSIFLKSIFMVRLEIIVIINQITTEAKINGRPFFCFLLISDLSSSKITFILQL